MTKEHGFNCIRCKYWEPQEFINNDNLCRSCNSKKRTKTIFDFPQFKDIEGDLSKDYLDELTLISDVESLNNFVLKWSNIWMLSYDPNNDFMNNHEYDLVNFAYNAQSTLECVQDLRKTGSCIHDSIGGGCCGLQIVLPVVLLYYMMIASKYIIPVNVAIIQGQKGLLGPSCEHWFERYF